MKELQYPRNIAHPDMPRMPDDIADALRVNEFLTKEQEQRADGVLKSIYEFMRKQRTRGVEFQDYDN